MSLGSRIISSFPQSIYLYETWSPILSRSTVSLEEERTFESEQGDHWCTGKEKKKKKKQIEQFKDRVCVCACVCVCVYVT